MFRWVVETERRFYLANEVDVARAASDEPAAARGRRSPTRGSGTCTAPSGSCPSVRVLTFRDVNVERLPETELSAAEVDPPLWLCARGGTVARPDRRARRRRRPRDAQPASAQERDARYAALRRARSALQGGRRDRHRSRARAARRCAGRSRAGWTSSARAPRAGARTGLARGPRPHPRQPRWRSTSCTKPYDRGRRRARRGGGDVARARLRPRARRPPRRGSARSSCDARLSIDFGGVLAAPAARRDADGQGARLDWASSSTPPRPLRARPRRPGSSSPTSWTTSSTTLAARGSRRGPDRRARALTSPSSTARCGRTFEAAAAPRRSAAQVAQPRAPTDAAEAIAAFLEKRDAQYRGR